MAKNPTFGSLGGTVTIPNKNSQSPGAKNHPVKPSGKKGGGVKVPVTRGTKGSKGSGYNR